MESTEEAVLPDDEQLIAAQRESSAAWRRLRLRIQSVSPRDLVRLVLIVGAIAALGWFLWQSRSTLIPFQIGIVLAYLMVPIVARLENYIPRWAAVLVVLATLLIVLGGVIAYLVPPVARQLNTALLLFPDRAQFQTWFTQVNEYLDRLPPETQTQIDEGINQALNSLRENITGYIRNTVEFMVNTVLGTLNTVTFLIGFIVIPFWLFFVLLDLDAGIKAVNRLIPAGFRRDFWSILQIFNRIIGNYFRGQLFLGIIIFFATYLGLIFLSMIGVEGIQFELLLALFAGFMELVPFIGPLLGAIPAIIVGAFHSWESALAILILYVIIQQVEGNVLVPRIVGDSVNIHPAMVMVLVVLLAPLGLIWLIIAVPATAILRDVYLYIYGRFQDPPKPAGLLPGDSEPVELTLLTPKDDDGDQEPISTPAEIEAVAAKVDTAAGDEPKDESS